VATATGIGASLSNGITGFIVDSFGYDKTFLFLAGLGVLGLGLYWFLVPETCKFEKEPVCEPAA
jgi:predicted MFS family arabinose efflux permease